LLAFYHEGREATGTKVTKSSWWLVVSSVSIRAVPNPLIEIRQGGKARIFNVDEPKK